MGGVRAAWSFAQSSRAEGLPRFLPTLHDVLQSPLLATSSAPCTPQGTRSWTLPLSLPGNSPSPALTATLTAMKQLRRRRRRGEGRTEMRKPGSGRGHVYDLDTGHDSASEEQAEDDLATPGGGASASVGTGHTVYMQVNFSLQVSPFNQYTFPSPPTSRPIYHPGCLVAPNGGYYWGARTAAHGQRTVALSMSLEMKEFILQLPSLGHE